MVEGVARDLKLPLFNPTISMQAFGQDAAMSDAKTSLSHYSEDFGAFLFDGLFKTYITGSLGAGGAERQMTRLAVEMKARHPSDNDKICVTGPIEVFVSNLSKNRGRDFFLPMLQQDDISVSVILGAGMLKHRSRDLHTPSIHCQYYTINRGSSVGVCAGIWWWL